MGLKDKLQGLAWTLRRGAIVLPTAVRSTMRLEERAPTGVDPGCEVAAQEALEWLCRAQDHSASTDGGVARSYSLLTGWASSYPETTGYIIPTFLERAKANQ